MSSMVVGSAFLYFGIFFISILSTWIAEVELKKVNKINFRSAHCIVFLLCSLVAILLPSLLAAFRAPTVGFDVKNYLIQNYNVALRSNSYYFFDTNKPFEVEPFFGLLTYFWAKQNNLKMLFFSIELLVIGPVYWVLFRRRKKGSMTVGMTLFFLLFYNFSLSGMRQSIAMSIMMIAYQMYEERKRFISFLFIVIAFNFHKSVALIVIVFGLFCYISALSKAKKKRVLFFLLVFLMILFVFYTRIALTVATLLQFISPRYGFYIKHYLDMYGGHIWSNIPLTDLIGKSLIIICYCCCYTHKNNEININAKSMKEFVTKDQFDIMLIMMLLGRYFVIFNANFFESLRIAYYFDFLQIFFVPSAFDLSLKKEKNILGYLIVMGSAFMYWFHFIIIIGGYSTNIYTLG